jgi:DNA-binding MarR family transcriptional regulator
MAPSLQDPRIQRWPDELSEWERDAALVVLRMGQAVSNYRAMVGLGRYGLDDSATTALIAVHINGPLTPREVAAAVHLTPPATTELLDRLDRAGYVTRGPHPSDRRKVLVASTQAGADLINSEWAAFARLVTPVLGSVDPGTRDQLLAAISRLEQVFTTANAAMTDTPAQRDGTAR